MRGTACNAAVMRAGLSLLLLLLFVSCSLEDGRDACCWANTVRFRYEHEGRDRFTEYIRDTRWFLFDGEGRFMEETGHMPDCPQRADISSLPAGVYTLVCLGNLEDYGSPEGHAGDGLDSFRLRVDDLAPDGRSFRGGDRLYWGECRFRVVPGNSNRFTGEMSNVHCVLHVRAEWELVPEFPGGYRFTLDGIGTGMELCGSRADSIGVHRFPPVTGFTGVTSEEVPLRRFALEGDLVTLRWDGAHIPRLRLWHGEDPVTREIDLADIFRRWGWHPERTPVQEYALRLLIRPDGSVVVSQGIGVDVTDWEDGGTVG